MDITSRTNYDLTLKMPMVEQSLNNIKHYTKHRTLTHTINT